MKEIWKDIAGYEGFYQVSNLGRVKSLDRVSQLKIGTDIPRKLKGGIKAMGVCGPGGCYKSVTLLRNGKPKYITVHRLVATAFIPNPQNKPCVNHKNGVKTDNRVGNLEWATSKENNHHADITGLWNSRGENQHLSKLKSNYILKIRSLIRLGIEFTEIANKFKVSPSTISDINRGKTWKHIL